MLELHDGYIIDTRYHEVFCGAFKGYKKKMFVKVKVNFNEVRTADKPR